MEGIIVKSIGGFFYVRTGEGIRKCVIRGKIRRLIGQVLVGDRVRVSATGNEEGVVEEVFPRQTELVRPPVANVDRALVVMAFKEPDPSAVLLDRFLVQVLVAGISPVICFNKYDLVEQEEPGLIQHYEKTGFPLLKVSAKTGFGIDKLGRVLKDHVNVLAGPSGVGKTSLLNTLQPGLSLKTGEISRKLGRGKHTTRHVELIELEKGGLVVDTPGFSSIFLPLLPSEKLGDCYPEFSEHAGRCRFSGCLHYKEPDCAIIKAVQQGLVSDLRYRNYLVLLEEIMNMERRHR